MGEENLNASIEALRAAAGEASISTKLVIPNDQIRWVDLPPEMARDLEAVRQAFDGETPYAIDELAIDTREIDGVALAAAVARETLAEADAFASAHGFGPAAFVAFPPDGTPLEFLFGSAAEVDASIERDDTPYMLAEPAEDAVAQIAIMDEIAEIGQAAGERPAGEHDSGDSAKAEPFPEVARNSLTAARAEPSVETGVETVVDAPGTAVFRSRRTPAAHASTQVAQAAGTGGASVKASAREAAPGRRVVFALLIALIVALGLLFVFWGESGPVGQSQLDENTRPSVLESIAALEPVVTTPLPQTGAGMELSRDAAPPPDIGGWLTEEELAEIDREGLELPKAVPTAEAFYADHGIWTRAPSLGPPPDASEIETFYMTSIDPVHLSADAVALPPVTIGRDVRLARLASPLPLSQSFELDEDGLVIATPEGALSPDGHLVFASRPPIVPPSRPENLGPAIGASTASIALLQNRRPLVRPEDLVENSERARFGGRSFDELALLRPQPRPQSAGELAAAQGIESEIDIASSLRPAERPEQVEVAAARALSSPPKAVEESSGSPVRAVAAAAPTRFTPSVASVARAATIDNALNLRRINLLGVYGTTSERRALVRLANGRRVQVEVGDRLDGGQVAAIGATELRYIKRGQNILLELPTN
ncbi:MAG: hypothetical protein AAF330_02225 [Pseudomonadota bacterium]